MRITVHFCFVIDGSATASFVACRHRYRTLAIEALKATAKNERRRPLEGAMITYTQGLLIEPSSSLLALVRFEG